MTPGKFLRLIWPATGHYCIAHPFTPQGSANTVYVHKVFPTIGEAVTHVHETMHTADTYFAMLSLREPQVWDPTKDNYKTGQKGAWATRLQSNMLAAKCVFWDLDVGPEASKYLTRKDALAALTSFVNATLMPMPMMVSSGGGVHAYWPFDADVPTLEWRDIAFQMRQLAETLKLRIDPTRTIDSSSVLRVLGTFNWKDRQNPREVVMLQEAAPTPVEVFKRLLSDALIKHGVQAQSAPLKAAPPLPTGLEEQRFNDFGPPPTLSEVAAACGQVNEIVASQGMPSHPHYGQLDNTAWYRGMMAVVGHVEDGDEWCRRLTAQHPRDNADVEAKILQLKQFPPARCETLAQFMPWKDAPCLTCRFNKDPSVPNPIAAARRSTLAPPPMATSPEPASSGSSAASTTVPTTPPSMIPALVAPSIALQAAQIANPPSPYERLASGGIAINRVDKDGNKSQSVIYGYDLYPLKRLVNGDAGMEQQQWRATLPRSGAKDFVIDADVIYDARKFATAMSHNGVYPNKADLPALQDYMVAYISQLQRDLDADNQTSHLGWGDGYRQFVLPDKTLLEDGTVRNSALTDGAKRAAQFITKGGDVNEQVKLMSFYDHPEYIPNQSVILDAFASIIFHATGNHGIVVNMSGASGVSKSTTLYTAASAWGEPKLWPINGTNRGATANARSQRLVTNANLPTMVDEITHLPAKDAIDLAMSVTQPGHRLRLGTDGNEKASNGTDYKSAIMVCSANSSLHALLSTDNAAGTAGSMRVFEMKFAAQTVHTKAQADEFLRQLCLHYGHLGELFAQFVVRHRAKVEHRVQTVMREVDAAGHIQSSERFWSARIASGIVAGEICKALHILPYAVEPILDWSIKTQIPFMRGVVKEEYRSPLAVLTDYIAEKNGSILVVDKATSIGANTSGQHVATDQAYGINNIHGALLGHYDIKAGVMYLLKQGFKDHCNRVGASSTRIVEELNTPSGAPGTVPRKIVVERQIRRTLGAGTPLAKGQVWCFAVDMTHPEMTGAVAPVIGSGVPTEAPTGQLRAVT